MIKPRWLVPLVLVVPGLLGLITKEPITPVIALVLIIAGIIFYAKRIYVE